MDNAAADLKSIRTKVADRFVIAGSLLSGPAVAMSCYRATAIGWQPVMDLHIALAVLFCIVAFNRQRMSFAFKAGALVVGMVAIGLGGVLQLGLMAPGIMFLIAAPPVTAMLFGTRPANFVFTGIITFMIFTAIHTLATGWLPPLDFQLYLVSWSAWGNELTSIALVTGVMLYALQGYHTSLVSALSSARGNEARLAGLTETLNARVRERTRELEQARHINGFAAEASRGFLVSADRDQAFAQLLDGVIRITESRFGFLASVVTDPDGGRSLGYRTILGVPEGAAGHPPSPRDFDSSSAYIRALTAHILLTGETIISDNPGTDSRLNIQAAGRPIPDAFLGVPIIFEDRMVGVVGIANRLGGYDAQLIQDMDVVWGAIAAILCATLNEEQRRHNEERINILSKAVEASPSLVVITDRQGKIQYANPRFGEVTGYTPEEAIGKTPAILKSGDLEPEIYVELWQTICSGKLWRGEVRNRRKDGAHYIAEVAIAPIVNDSKVITHFVGVQEDVTEKRRAIDALMVSEKRYREIVDAAGKTFNFYSLTPEGDYLYASATSRDWFGIDESRLIGRNWSKITPWTDDSVERGRVAMGQCRKGEVPRPIALEYHLNGLAHHLLSYPRPVSDDKGQVIRIEGISVDVTERLRLEQELRLAAQSAESANRAKSEFLSSMSHELRTPLNAVIGFAQMMEYNSKETLTPSQKKCVERILRGGQHLLELISQILDLSKIEEGKLELVIGDVAVDEIMRECLSFIQPQAERHGVSIRIALEPGLMVKADYTRLKQVLLNLLSNAVKYSRSDGQVDMSAKVSNDGTIAILVSDNGIGVPEARRDELFKPFCRLGRENSGIEGTGIGLTITKRLVELMDGDISLDCTTGIGSTFRVVLPLSQAVFPVNEIYGNMCEPNVDGLSGTVVYVEDNPANVELMEMVISRIDGVSLLTAPSGELGVSLIRQARPDLVILDLNLPGIDGYEVLGRLRRTEGGKEIPVFALTAAATRSDINRGRQAGFAKYLTKPFTVDVLVNAIREVLAKRPSECFEAGSRTRNGKP